MTVRRRICLALLALLSVSSVASATVVVNGPRFGGGHGGPVSPTGGGAFFGNKSGPIGP